MCHLEMRSCPNTDGNGRYDVTSPDLKGRGNQRLSKRRNHDAGFMAHRALEAVKGERIVSEVD